MEKIKLNEEQIEEYVDIITNFKLFIQKCGQILLIMIFIITVISPRFFKLLYTFHSI